MTWCESSSICSARQRRASWLACWLTPCWLVVCKLERLSDYIGPAEELGGQTAKHALLLGPEPLLECKACSSCTLLTLFLKRGKEKHHGLGQSIAWGSVFLEYRAPAGDVGSQTTLEMLFCITRPNNGGFQSRSVHLFEPGNNQDLTCPRASLFESHAPLGGATVLPPECFAQMPDLGVC